MKKRVLTKVMALAMVCAMAMGNMGMVVHASDDGCVRSENEAGGGGDFSWGDSGSSSSSSSSSSASSSSSSSSSNYSAPSYDDGCARSENAAGGGGDYNFGASDNRTVSVPAGLAVKGNTVSVAGGETFRQINKAADGQVAIYHCGIEQYTAQLKDAKGNAVAYKSCGIYLDEATGKYYLNIVTEQDATGYTVGTYKGSVDYLVKLGLSGVMVNDVVAVEATAK